MGNNLKVLTNDAQENLSDWVKVKEILSDMNKYIKGR